MTAERDTDTLDDEPLANIPPALALTRRDRVTGTVVGVAAGGAAGAVGAAFLAPWAAPVALAAGALAALGGVLGYHWGRKIGGAILDAFTSAV